MIRTLLACAVTGVAVLALTATGVFGASTAKHKRFTPACPHARYRIDGTMSPLFCVIDNPRALKYFARMGKPLFALGPDATPNQVLSALEKDRKPAGTLPILCSIYRLAAWREHWSFGVSPAQMAVGPLHLYQGWCSDPSFPKVGN